MYETGGHVQGAKPAITSTLKGQTPYFAMQITRLMVLLGGRSKTMQNFSLRGNNPCLCRYVSARGANVIDGPHFCIDILRVVEPKNLVEGLNS